MRGVVYKYTSPSGKVYIGQTCREKGRRKDFRSSAPYSDGFLINNARKKYGPENFLYEVLFQIESEDGQEVHDALNYWESYYIAHFKSNDKRYGYNMNEGGSGNVGLVVSEETRAKLSAKSKARLAIHHPMKGEKHTPESIALMKENTKKKFGKDNPNYGWKPTAEQRKMFSERAKQNTGEKIPSLVRLILTSLFKSKENDLEDLLFK